MSDLVAVHIECPCPNRPHAEGDTVSLRPKLDLAGGTAVQSLFSGYLQASAEEEQVPNWQKLAGLMTEGYLLNGIMAWTLVDEQGAALPLNDRNIRAALFDDFAVSKPIADVADGLYYEAVLAPLVNRLNESLQRSQTRRSTSPTKNSKARTARLRSPSTPPSLKPVKLPKPSSTSTTQTDATETTLRSLGRASTG